MIRAQADVIAEVVVEHWFLAAVVQNVENVHYRKTGDGFAEARRWIPVLRGDLVYRAPLPGGAS